MTIPYSQTKTSLGLIHKDNKNPYADSSIGVYGYVI